MKKFIITAVIAALAFAGCGSGSNDDNSLLTPRPSVEECKEAAASGEFTSRLRVNCFPDGRRRLTLDEITGCMDEDIANGNTQCLDRVKQANESK